MGRQNERTGSLGCGHLVGLFLDPAKVEEHPFALETAALSVQVGIVPVRVPDTFKTCPFTWVVIP